MRVTRVRVSDRLTLEARVYCESPLRGVAIEPTGRVETSMLVRRHRVPVWGVGL